MKKKRGGGKGNVRIFHCLHEFEWVTGRDGGIGHGAGGHRAAARRVREIAELECPIRCRGSVVAMRGVELHT